MLAYSQFPIIHGYFFLYEPIVIGSFCLEPRKLKIAYNCISNVDMGSARDEIETLNY